MGKKENKKCRRRIRIRLADPNVPDSYVCEIFDSSLENEDEASNDFLKSEEPILQSTKNDCTKPKNYFEILMSKNCKKKVKINSAKEIEEICEETKESDDEKLIEGRKVKKKKKKVLSQIKSKNGNTNKKDETDSSDDESLFQIQKKLETKVKADSFTDVKKVVKLNNSDSQDDVLTIFDSNKVDYSKKKNLSILSYFSPEVIPNSNKYHKTKNKKLDEINAKNSLNTTLKQITNKNIVELEQNEYKVPINGINKENVKLAPLFHKKEKRVIDPATQKARLDFLFKGSQLLVKKQESSKNIENSVNFPIIPHIQQRDDSVYWSLRDICIPFSNISYLDEYIFSNDKRFQIKIRKVNVGDNIILNNTVEFNKQFLCKIKCKYLGLGLDVIIDGLKEKRDKFTSQLEKFNKSVDESGCEFLNNLWTEKYKPNTNEILGNGNVVRKLKKWLQSWKTFDEQLKALVKSGKKLKNQKESDSDDFLESDDDFGLKAPGNVCILSGPNGCGKTALVFALASELEFTVLEVNASSKRTGKKVLSDLHEATKSHKVHRVNLLPNEPAEKGKKKKKGKQRKKTKTEIPSKISEQTNDCKISLILVEDADIVFEEHDEGFVSAMASLVQTSKRPLIFLTNESNCGYLDNFKTEQCLILEMEQPDFYKSCAVLDVVSCLEGASLDKNLLEALLRQNDFDLRKTLLELQFWTQPRLNNFRLLEHFDFGHLWWGLSKFLHGKEIGHFVKPQSRKRKRNSEFFDSSDEEELTAKKLKLQSEDCKNRSQPKSESVITKSDPSIPSYHAVLDVMSILDGFRLSRNHEPTPGFECRPKDSLSLEENMEEVSWMAKNLTDQLGEELVSLSTRIFSRKYSEKETKERKLSCVAPSWEEIRWRKSQEKASEELSVLVPLLNGRDKRSLHLDYLPMIRGICRVERNRLVLNPKRKNRFYHYLNNLGLELTDENIEINCDILGS